MKFLGMKKGLNGASDISEELRQTVLDTAVEMGYSTKRSRKVENRKLALFIENMNYESIDEFGYDVVLGFKQNAFKHKWDVDIIPVTLISFGTLKPCSWHSKITPFAIVSLPQRIAVAPAAGHPDADGA